MASERASVLALGFLIALVFQVDCRPSDLRDNLLSDENLPQSHHGYSSLPKDDFLAENDDGSFNQEENVEHKASSHHNNDRSFDLEVSEDDPNYHPNSRHHNQEEETRQGVEDAAAKRGGRGCISCCRNLRCAMANDHRCGCYPWDDRK